MTTVLVADGQRLLAEALSRTLQGYPDLDVVEPLAASGEDVIKAIERVRPDVALVDYWMLGLDGPAVSRAAARCAPATKVLLLSWVHGPDQVQEALAAGAAGFLPKSLTVDQVVHAVRQAHEGSGLVCAEELATLVEDINGRIAEAERKSAALETLTPRELDILVRLCPGRSTEELAPELGIRAGTLKNHIHKILAKTGARTRIEVIELARWQDSRAAARRTYLLALIRSSSLLSRYLLLETKPSSSAIVRSSNWLLTFVLKNHAVDMVLQCSDTDAELSRQFFRREAVPKKLEYLDLARRQGRKPLRSVPGTPVTVIPADGSTCHRHRPGYLAGRGRLLA